MLFLSRPTPDQILCFSEDKKQETFSYQDVGISKDGHIPAGFGKDHVRAQIGVGRNTFARAVKFLKDWQEFDVGWVEVYPAKPTICPGTDVAVLAKHWFFWSLNFCRIAYVVEAESEASCRYGFGWGTLFEHMEKGEERFLLEWRHDSDAVFYDILAFSNPHLIWSRLAWPLTRFVQNKFRRDSLSQMKRHLS